MEDSKPGGIPPMGGYSEPPMFISNTEGDEGEPHINQDLGTMIRIKQELADPW